MKRRRLEVLTSDEIMKIKEPQTDAYIHKWAEWQRDITPRGTKWGWRKKGKSWQLTLSLTDEMGVSHNYSRWGKTKKKTQRSLAKVAWYRYLNRDEDDEFEEHP